MYVLFDPKQLWSNTNESMFLNNESETIKGTFDPIVSSDIIIRRSN
jgi:hypothetical protein